MLLLSCLMFAASSLHPVDAAPLQHLGLESVRGLMIRQMQLFVAMRVALIGAASTSLVHSFGIVFGFPLLVMVCLESSSIELELKDPDQLRWNAGSARHICGHWNCWSLVSASLHHKWHLHGTFQACLQELMHSTWSSRSSLLRSVSSSSSS